MTWSENPEVRVIPVVLIKNGNVVQSYGFEHHPVLGGAPATLERLLNYQADEIIVLDISGNEASHALGISRPDIGLAGSGPRGLAELLKRCAGSLLYPLAVGGGIRGLRQAEELVGLGADKIVLNQATIHNRSFIEACVSIFGTQAIVASVNILETDEGIALYDWVTKKPITDEPGFFDFLHLLEAIGCGEIFLNNVSRDGKRKGQNLELIGSVVEAVAIPVIACGGVGTRADFVAAARAGASAVAAGNFFHSHELSYPFVKKEMAETLRVRTYVPREEPVRRESPADVRENKRRVYQRLQDTSELWNNRYQTFQSQPVEFKRCRTCLYPLHAAITVSFSPDDLCSGCSRFVDSDLGTRSMDGRMALSGIIASKGSQRNQSEYDCIVAVSGGKDSYFQTHYVIHELGLNPLLVTYDGNNWTDVGLENLHNMKSAFGVDHLVVSPPEELLKRMNLAGFLMLGDMSWHAHVGIVSVPMSVAADMGISLVFYGEHGREDIAGQFRYGDFPEVTYRERLEHFGRGSEWSAFQGLFGIGVEDLSYWRYPTDAELFESELRGLHLGSFIKWDPHKQTDLVRSLYGFKTANVPFDRTYRRGSNLDDMHENGLHDWLKYVKFGYGRATDHASKDIRLGKLVRESALDLAKHHDSALPSDIERWLQYAGLSRDLFFAIGNSFRSHSVWRFNGQTWQHPEGMSDKWVPSPSSGIDFELQNLKTIV